MRRRL